MIVLAIDTALGACQAALIRDDHVLAACSEPMTRGHQERIAPMTAELFIRAGLAPEAVDRVAVTTGPGSFTGLRVGLAFAKGLALGLEAPVVGIGALQALALESAGAVAAMIAAPHDRIYLQTFLDGDPTSAPALMETSAADARLCSVERTLGPGALDGLPAYPDPAAIARFAAAAPMTEVETTVQPLYLRPPDAKTIAERAAGQAAAPA